MDKRQKSLFALENSLDRLDVSDEELLAISFVFEYFLKVQIHIVSVVQC
jgi:hypothetical protein